MSLPISVLILTKNEEKDLPNCLDSVRWSDDVHIFDSMSTDKTLDIAKAYSAHVVQRSYVDSSIAFGGDESAHRNWGLHNIRFKYDWVLLLDADEKVSDNLYQELLRMSERFSSDDSAAYEIQRRDFSWNGKWLRYSQVSPFYIRLVKPDLVKYERLINPVIIVTGPVQRLPGFIDHYPFSKGLRYWWSRHLSYADMESKVFVNNLDRNVKFSMIKAFFSKSFSERRYHQKGIFYKLPLRPLLKWIYIVIWRRGFLDGRDGIIYAFMIMIYEFFILQFTSEILAKEVRSEK